MSAYVNMQIIVTLFASLLFKVDSEMEDSFSYEAGYNLSAVALALIIFTSTIGVEILRYLKTAVEFASSLVIVETSLHGLKMKPIRSSERSFCATLMSWLQKEDQVEVDNERKEAETHLKKCISQSQEFLESLHDEMICQKLSKKTKVQMARIVKDASKWLKENRAAPKGLLDEKAEELQEQIKAATAKTSPAGLYFALGPDLNSFPQMSIFQQFQDAILRGFGRDTCALWWDKNIYVNDASAWIIRRTTHGWELVPFMSWQGDPAFIVDGHLQYPPNEGWQPLLSSSLNMTSLSPFRSKCCNTYQHPRRDIDVGARTSDLSARLLSDRSNSHTSSAGAENLLVDRNFSGRSRASDVTEVELGHCSSSVVSSSVISSSAGASDFEEQLWSKGHVENSNTAAIGADGTPFDAGNFKISRLDKLEKELKDSKQQLKEQEVAFKKALEEKEAAFEEQEVAFGKTLKEQEVAFKKALEEKEAAFEVKLETALKQQQVMFEREMNDEKRIAEEHENDL